MKKERLTALRRRTGLTIPKFAAKLGVARSTLFRWETGSRAIGHFEADAIERLVDRLLEESLDA